MTAMTGRNHFAGVDTLPVVVPFAPLYGPLTPTPAQTLADVVAALIAADSEVAA